MQAACSGERGGAFCTHTAATAQITFAARDCLYLRGPGMPAALPSKRAPRIERMIDEFKCPEFRAEQNGTHEFGELGFTDRSLSDLSTGSRAPQGAHIVNIFSSIGQARVRLLIRREMPQQWIFTELLRYPRYHYDMIYRSREPGAECPACRHPMAPMDRNPIVSTDCLVDVTYICEWCGTETKRAVREQAKLSHARGGGRHDPIRSVGR